MGCVWLIISLVMSLLTAKLIMNREKQISKKLFFLKEVITIQNDS